MVEDSAGPLKAGGILHVFSSVSGETTADRRDFLAARYS